MAKNSKIEWTDHTFNFWIGCSKVSAGCRGCYAEHLMDKRYKRATWGVNGSRTLLSEATRKKPYKWNKEAGQKGIKYKVFAQSLSDTFEELHENHPQRNDLKKWRVELFEIIKNTTNLIWILVTKRLKTAQDFYQEYPQYANLPNVWFLCSIENQETANERIIELLKIPAVVRGLSVEPLLGEVDLGLIYEKPCGCKYKPLACSDCNNTRTELEQKAIDWVIVGGESGHHARPMHPDWVRSIKDQCQEANVPFFFKQWGEWLPVEKINGSWYNNGGSPTFTLGYLADQYNFDENNYAAKVGKKHSGNLLDGVQYQEYPKQ